MSTAEPMLKVSSLRASYGEVLALRDVSLEARRAEIVALLGVNGAGKSTVLRTISGLIGSASGSIVFKGQPILGLSPRAIYRSGLVHVQEGQRVFPGLTVRDNLLVGAANRPKARSRQAVEDDIKEMLELFPPLRLVVDRRGWTLSGGERQALAIAQGLMARPDLLMLDEPTLGLAPVLVQDLFKTIRLINETGMTILLVEQNVRMALSVAHRAYVLELGETSLSGEAHELMRNPEIQAAYLGGSSRV